jgi:hypothetical protein
MIVFIHIASVESPTVLVVHSICVVQKTVIQNLENSACADSVFPVLDGEADDLCIWSGSSGNRNDCFIVSIDDRVVDKLVITSCVKMRSQYNRLACNPEVFSICTGSDQHESTLRCSIDPCLDGWPIFRNPDCT